VAPADELRYQPLTGEWSDAPDSVQSALRDPDRRDGAVYVYEPRLKLAVDVALATGRPLLIEGEPGSGKSSLAAYAARNLGWRYYEHVVSSRTRASDVLWRFDSVRRLADSQARATGGAPLNDYDYVEPGVLWWVFDRGSARRRGAPDGSAATAVEQYADVNSRRSDRGCVVLLDEIDKADPDLPNALLVPLASRRFIVSETGTEVRYELPGPDGHDSRSGGPAEGPLIIITTNQERELPPAFLRRCVVHRLRFPASRLVEIAERHARAEGVVPDQRDREAVSRIAERVVELRKEATARGERPAGTAEFLDAVRAFRTLRPDGLESRAWEVIERLTLRKHEDDDREDDVADDVNGAVAAAEGAASTHPSSA
jgi:MoxR-like ATPase